MSKFLIALSLMFLGFESVATDGSFKGSYRVRANGMGSGSLSESFGSGSSFNALNIRAYTAGKFKPSESLEATAGVYTIFNGMDAELVPMGYGDWMLSDEIMIRGGRATYEIAHGEVIGKNKYQDVPVFFEGLFLTHLSDVLGLDLALAKVLTPFEDLVFENYFGIASLDLKSLPEILGKVNVHAIVNADEVQSFRVGATLGGEASGVGYKATVAYDGTSESSGDSDSATDSILINAMIGYKHKWNDQKVKLYVGAHYDGANYDAFLYDRHKYAGAIDLVGLGGGLQYGHVGASYWIDSSLSVGVKGYYFNEVANILVAEAPIEIDSGSMEVDAYIMKEFNSSVYGKLWIASLRNSQDQYVSRVEAQLTMKF